MRSANKVALVDTVNRANLTAGAAARAFRVVDGSKVIDNLNCSLRTALFALTAGNTADKAGAAHLCALVVVTALYNDTGGVLNERNNVIWAGFCTKSAADTLLRVDFGNTALGNGDGIARTYVNAVAVAEAGEAAVSVTREGEICRATALRAVVNILFLLRTAGAVAGNVCYHFDNVTRFKS